MIVAVQTKSMQIIFVSKVQNSLKKVSVGVSENFRDFFGKPSPLLAS